VADVRVLVVVTAVVGVLGVGAGCGDDGGEPPASMCTADALLDPDGTGYARSPDEGCRFVDDEGAVVERLSDGERICYDDGMAVVTCE
jgi:hypothetical protein